MIFATPRAEVSPPVLFGRGLDGSDQIVIGAATLAVLHKHVGDTVLLRYGTATEAPLYIPTHAFGNRGDRHLSGGWFHQLRRRPYLDGQRCPPL